MSHLNYFVFRETEETCAKCGWTGRGKEFAVGELFDELAEYHCPACDSQIAIQCYPTLAEAKAAWHLLDEKEQKEWLERERIHEIRERTRLRSADQLPAIAEPRFVLTWELVRDPEANLDWTVIRHEQREVWREPAIYDGAEHFARVVGIMQTRYGSALEDVIPSGGQSELYLFGDDLQAPAKVLAVRRKLGGGRVRKALHKQRTRNTPNVLEP